MAAIYLTGPRRSVWFDDAEVSAAVEEAHQERRDCLANDLLFFGGGTGWSGRLADHQFCGDMNQVWC